MSGTTGSGQIHIDGAKGLLDCDSSIIKEKRSGYTKVAGRDGRVADADRGGKEHSRDQGRMAGRDKVIYGAEASVSAI